MTLTTAFHVSSILLATTGLWSPHRRLVTPRFGDDVGLDRAIALAQDTNRIDSFYQLERFITHFALELPEGDKEQK